MNEEFVFQITREVPGRDGIYFLLDPDSVMIQRFNSHIHQGPWKGGFSKPNGCLPNLVPHLVIKCKRQIGDGVPIKIPPHQSIGIARHHQLREDVRDGKIIGSDVYKRQVAHPSSDLRLVLPPTNPFDPDLGPKSIEKGRVQLEHR